MQPSDSLWARRHVRQDTNNPIEQNSQNSSPNQRSEFINDLFYDFFTCYTYGDGKDFSSYNSNTLGSPVTVGFMVGRDISQWNWFNRLTFGIGFRGYSVDAHYYEIGTLNSPKELGILTYSDNVITIGVSSTMFKMLNVGFALHNMRSNFAGYSTPYSVNPFVNKVYDLGFQYALFENPHELNSSLAVKLSWIGNKEWETLGKEKNYLNRVLFGYHIGFLEFIENENPSNPNYIPGHILTLYSEMIMQEEARKFSYREAGVGLEWNVIQALSVRLGSRHYRDKFQNFNDTETNEKRWDIRGGFGLRTMLLSQRIKVNLGCLFYESRLYATEIPITLSVSLSPK